MAENTEVCPAETAVVELLGKIDAPAATVERWQAFHKRSHNLFGAAEYADAEVDPYVDPTRFGSTPITVGQHNTILLGISQLMAEGLDGLAQAADFSDAAGIPLPAMLNPEEWLTRLNGLLDSVEALDALIEAASVTGLSMDTVPEGWAGLA